MFTSESRTRWSRRDRWSAGAIIAVGGLVIATASGVVVASASSTPAVYTGCLDHKTRTVYRVGINATSAPTCRTGDHRMKWNSRGPVGPVGPRGPRGFTGPPGPSSVASLVGTPCTTTEGPAGTLGLTTSAENAVVLTCHSTALVPIVFTDPAAQVLATHTFGGTAPTTLAVPADCGAVMPVSCPGNSPSNPLPTVTLDHTLHNGDLPRAAGAVDGSGSAFDLTGRFRLATDTSIPVEIASQPCTMDYDSTRGSVPDLTFGILDSVVAADGPTEVNPNRTLDGVEAADVTLAGPGTCSIASLTASQVANILESALNPWVNTVGAACGATVPDYFQDCPA